MRLTSSPGPFVRSASRRAGPRTLTTEPGFVNPNRQVVERATGVSSAERRGQTVYALRCRDCSHAYGCNGLDIKERRCPACQGGVKGEPIPERQQGSLFG